MEKLIVFGIPNCDTMKKTFDWLKKNKKEYIFHDYKQSGITKDQLTAWCKQAGWEIVLNKKSTTWRNLGPDGQAKINNQKAAVQLMMEQNSIIKRPVIVYKEHLLIGYNEEIFIQQLK